MEEENIIEDIIKEKFPELKDMISFSVKACQISLPSTLCSARKQSQIYITITGGKKHNLTLFAFLFFKKVSMQSNLSIFFLCFLSLVPFLEVPIPPKYKKKCMYAFFLLELLLFKM